MIWKFISGSLFLKVQLQAFTTTDQYILQKRQEYRLQMEELNSASQELNSTSEQLKPTSRKMNSPKKTLPYTIPKSGKAEECKMLFGFFYAPIYHLGGGG